MRGVTERWDAVLFDVDGTLIDSLEVIVAGLQETYRRFCGIEVAPLEVRSVIGMPLREQLRLFSAESPSEARVLEMTEFAISRFAANKAQEREYGPSVDALRRAKLFGLSTALVTSKTRQELDLFLSEFTGAPAVDTAVCASDIVNPKPDPESALLACERLGVLPERALFVGDSAYDMRCARAAGCTSIAVSYGSAPRAVLEAERPDVLLETPESLLAWIEHQLAPEPIAHA